MTTVHTGSGAQTLVEIESQPELWERALALAADGVPGLPEPGERVLVLGCGTSYYVGQAYASLREGSGHGPTEALIASETPRSYARTTGSWPSAGPGPPRSSSTPCNSCVSSSPTCR